MKIIIPFEIPSQNVTEKGLSWRVRAAKTKARRNDWRIACVFAMRGAGIVNAAGPRSLRIIAYRKRYCSDIANLIGGAKACIDGLVDAGLIMDDRDAKARITYAQELASASPLGRGTTCTVIEVTE